jgi:hypothetical protein
MAVGSSIAHPCPTTLPGRVSALATLSTRHRLATRAPHVSARASASSVVSWGLTLTPAVAARQAWDEGSPLVSDGEGSPYAESPHYWWQ